MNDTYISGAGGGGKSGGGGSARAAKEAPDTLKSKQFAKVLDLLGEGEIEGLVAGLKSVYLDGTPVQNRNGSFNFKNVELEFRTGTQEQSPMSGFQGAEAETGSGVEIQNGLPITFRVNDLDAEQVRLTLGVPRLTSQNIKTGDINGSQILLKVQIQSNNGGYRNAPVTLDIGNTNLSISKTKITNNGDSIVLTAGGGNSSGILGALLWSRPITGTTTVTSQQQPAGGFSYYIPPTRTTINLYGGVPPRIKFEYRAVGDATWNEVSQNTFKVPSTNRISGSLVNLDIQDLYPGSYEFRITKLSGTGSINVQGDAIQVGVLVSTPVVNSKGQVQTDAKGNTKYTQKVGTEVVASAGIRRYLRNPDILIKGKTIQKYQRNETIPLIGQGPWDIRISKVTADSTNSSLINNVFLDSYTTIVPERLSYPNSAYVYMKIDSEQFSRIPSRGYHVRLLRVRVPTNYNPNTREYTGVWDGSFKVAWTDNPAWCYFDLLTNTRYGLGAFVPEALIDKWDLYNIGKYCDELVPDGYGGLEPRFTLNIYLQTREEAYNVIQSLTSVFRGMAYWTGGSISTVQDAPSDPIAIFNKANVVEGVFSYSGTSQKARHSVALVTWNDPLNEYKQAVEYVEDQASVERYGIREAEVVAVGCTSRGQANRVGKWLLYSEKEETETVTFKSGLEGVSLAPGRIIEVHDPDRAGIRFSGRIKRNSTGNIIKLDSEVRLQSNREYTLSVTMPYAASKELPNGQTETTNIAAIEKRTFSVSITGNYSEIELNESFSEVPDAFAIWLIQEASLKPQLFRLLEVTEEQKNIYKILAIEHNPSKFDFIDDDEPLKSNQISVIMNSPLAPDELRAEESLYVSESGEVLPKIELSWGFKSNALNYVVEYRFEEDNWKIVQDVPNSVFTLNNTAVGIYDFRVRSVDALGRISATATELLGFETLGKTAPPANVQNLVATEVFSGVLLSWDRVLDLDLDGYIIKYGNDWDNAQLLSDNIKSTSIIHEEPGSGVNTYLIRAVDTTGNVSKLITSVDIRLTPPNTVRKFIAVQNKSTIQLNWDGIPEAALYEIREGDSWESSSLVARTDTTYFNVSSGLEGTRLFWIKSISKANIYSEIASVTTSDYARLPDRNIILEVDKEVDSYAGRYINTQSILGEDIRLLDIERTPNGEFIFDIDLGYNVNAQSSPNYTLGVAQIDDLAWEDIGYGWGSNSANVREWEPLGETDITTVSGFLEIATDTGFLNSTEIEAAGLDGSLNTYSGITPLESLSTNFSLNGRNGQSVDIVDTSRLSWSINVPQVFSEVFWLTPLVNYSDFSARYSLFTLENSVTGDHLHLFYEDGNLILEGSDLETISIPFTFFEEAPTAIGISQSTTRRRLMAARIFETNQAVEGTITVPPISTFDTVRLY